MILRLLRNRFGEAPDSEARLRAALETITDVEVLGGLFDRAVTVASRDAFDAVVKGTA